MAFSPPPYVDDQYHPEGLVLPWELVDVAKGEEATVSIKLPVPDDWEVGTPVQCRCMYHMLPDTPGSYGLGGDMKKRQPSRKKVRRERRGLSTKPKLDPMGCGLTWLVDARHLLSKAERRLAGAVAVSGTHPREDLKLKDKLGTQTVWEFIPGRHRRKEGRIRVASPTVWSLALQLVGAMKARDQLRQRVDGLEECVDGDRRKDETKRQAWIAAAAAAAEAAYWRILHVSSNLVPDIEVQCSPAEQPLLESKIFAAGHVPAGDMGFFRFTRRAGGGFPQVLVRAKDRPPTMSYEFTVKPEDVGKVLEVDVGDSGGPRDELGDVAELLAGHNVGFLEGKAIEHILASGETGIDCKARDHLLEAVKLLSRKSLDLIPPSPKGDREEVVNLGKVGREVLFSGGTGLEKGPRS